MPKQPCYYITLVGISCLTGYYYGTQNFHLCKTVHGFSSLAVCTAHSATIYTTSFLPPFHDVPWALEGGIFQLSFTLGFSVSCNQSVWCLQQLSLVFYFQCPIRKSDCSLYCPGSLRDLTGQKLIEMYPKTNLGCLSKNT